MTTAGVKRVGGLGLLALALAAIGVTQYRRIREERRRAPMGGPRLARVRAALPVHTRDAVLLGPVTAVWRGTDPPDEGVAADEEVCSRVEVRSPDGPLYIPYDALGGVVDGAVVLTLSAAEVRARPWSYRPDWLPPRGRPEPVPSWAS
jgi:hypothetical protein